MVFGILVQSQERFCVSPKSHPRAMWRAIPDDREKGLLRAYLFLHEAERFLDDDFGGITLKFLELSLAAHDWIQIEKLVTDNHF